MSKRFTAVPADKVGGALAFYGIVDQDGKCVGRIIRMFGNTGSRWTWVSAVGKWSPIGYASVAKALDGFEDEFHGIVCKMSVKPTS